jgi:hypothetical protein
LAKLVAETGNRALSLELSRMRSLLPKNVQEFGLQLSLMVQFSSEMA